MKGWFAWYGAMKIVKSTGNSCSNSHPMPPVHFTEINEEEKETDRCICKSTFKISSNNFYNSIPLINESKSLMQTIHMCKEKDRKSELVEKLEGKEYAAREKKRKRRRKGTGKRERERDEVEGDGKAERR